MSSARRCALFERAVGRDSRIAVLRADVKTVLNGAYRHLQSVYVVAARVYSRFGKRAKLFNAVRMSNRDGR